MDCASALPRRAGEKILVPVHQGHAHVRELSLDVGAYARGSDPGVSGIREGGITVF